LNKNRFRWWIGLGLILVGVGLLITVLVGFFATPANPAVNPDVTTTAGDRGQVATGSGEAAGSTGATSSASASLTPTRQPSPTATPVMTPEKTAGVNGGEQVTTGPTPLQATRFDGQLAYEHVLAQVDLGPRPTGSEAGWATGEFIIGELERLDWQAESQEFFFKGVRGRNIIGRREGASGPVVIIGAHYDTRPAADRDPDEALRTQWIDGANDGASGVAVLLELARALEAESLDLDVWLAFFDAEDRGRLEGWPFSVGARHMAENLRVNPQSVVVVDMIGDADPQLFFERNSTDELSVEIWNVAAELGYSDYFIPELRHTIIDDHVPFLERQIPAVDIIDFDYPYWHTVEDTADKVSPESLERVGRTLEVWLEEKR
jgi:hypothetical protein